MKLEDFCVFCEARRHINFQVKETEDGAGTVSQGRCITCSNTVYEDGDWLRAEDADPA